MRFSSWHSLLAKTKYNEADRNVHGGVNAMKSLYSEVGGDEVIEKVVKIMYRKVLADKNLIGFFADVDTVLLRRKLRRFLHVATGGPDRISGLEIRAAHDRAVGMGLSQKHVEAWLGHFRAALEAANIDEEIADRVLASVGLVRDDVLGR